MIRQWIIINVEIKFKIQMLKNKTHRIISISPTSQSGYLKNANNKTVTPIKPFHLPTRANTIKTTIKPDQNELAAMEETSKKNLKSDNYIESVIISSYKDEGNINLNIKQEGASVNKKDSFHIDEILNRIGKNYENEKNNISNQLLKKTRISELRQCIRNAKLLIKSKQQQNENDPFTCGQSSSTQIENLSHIIKEQISSLFSTIHKELYKKQKELYQCLEQKIFQLKQKNITKYFQTASLKSYIQTCEVDINKNYEGIIQELEIKQLMRIVNSYMKKIQFYSEKIKDGYSLKLCVPEGITELNFLSHLSIDITKLQQSMLVPHVSMFQSEKAKCNNIKNRISLDRSLKLSLSKESKKIQGEMTNAHSNLNTNNKNRGEQVQILQLNKIFAKKIKNNKDYEPRISSARGRY